MTSVPPRSNVRVAGTTTYAKSPVTRTCRGSSRVMWKPEAPTCSPAASTSFHQSSLAVGPCHTYGDITSRICIGSTHVPAMASASPSLKASTYWRTAAIGSLEVGTVCLPVAYEHFYYAFVARLVQCPAGPLSSAQALRLGLGRPARAGKGCRGG